eukprot:gene52628-5574_t
MRPGQWEYTAARGSGCVPADTDSESCGHDSERVEHDTLYGSDHSDDSPGAADGPPVCTDGMCLDES